MFVLFSFVLKEVQVNVCLTFTGDGGGYLPSGESVIGSLINRQSKQRELETHGGEDECEEEKRQKTENKPLISIVSLRFSLSLTSRPLLTCRPITYDPYHL